MLHIRIGTALLLIGIVATTLLYAPPWAFQVLVLLAVLFAFAEYNRLALSHLRGYRLPALLVGMGVATAQSLRLPPLPIDAVLIAALFVLALVYMYRTTIFEQFPERLAIAFFGIVYIGLTLPYLGWIRQLDHGRALVGMTLAMVALSDTAAFAVGKMLGKRKLAALISPKKTLEGFIAGFAGSVAGALAFRAAFYEALPMWPCVALGLLIGFVAPMGDLVESAIKRACHVKDSGAMLPGHGGMLDRCDAYFFSAPVVYYFFTKVMGLE